MTLSLPDATTPRHPPRKMLPKATLGLPRRSAHPGRARGVTAFSTALAAPAGSCCQADLTRGLPGLCPGCEREQCP